MKLAGAAKILGSMPALLKRNAMIVLGLAVLFVISKYRVTLLRMPPLGQDPCDAVCAFTIVMALPITALSLARAFRRYRIAPASQTQCLFLIRAQQAVVLAVFITLIAYVFALARHPSLWISAAGRSKLLAWIGTLGVASIGTQLLIRTPRPTARSGSATWKSVVVGFAVPVLILAFSPEWPIDNSSETTHILTIICAAFVVFAPMRVLLPALVPIERDEVQFSTAREWIALIFGILLGALAFWGGISKVGGAFRFAHHALLDFWVAALLIGYAVLRRPLGLGLAKAAR